MVLQLHTQSVTSVCWQGTTVTYTVRYICLLTWFLQLNTQSVTSACWHGTTVTHTVCYIYLLTWFLWLNTQPVTSVCWHGTTVTYTVCHICMLTWYYSYTVCDICMLTWYYSYTRSLSHLYADMVLQLHTQSVTSVCWQGFYSNMLLSPDCKTVRTMSFHAVSSPVHLTPSLLLSY